MDNLTYDNIHNLVISLAVILLTVVILPAVRTWLKSKTSAEQNNVLLSFIEELVKAAEQMYRPGMTQATQGLNFVKKDYVMREAVAFANRQGIPISHEQLEALVEAAVYALKLWGRPVTVVAES